MSQNETLAIGESLFHIVEITLRFYTYENLKDAFMHAAASNGAALHRTDS